jgi:flavin-dependent dehydrogenase
MNKYPKTLLVIVTEAVLEKTLVREAREHGAQGWTITDVRGAWREGERSGDWEADRTIEMKIVCEATVADAIAEQVLAVYAPNYSVAIWFKDVTVLRPDRY